MPATRVEAFGLNASANAYKPAVVTRDERLRSFIAEEGRKMGIELTEDQTALFARCVEQVYKERKGA